ncbi:MAG: acetoacetate decarboxylase family protein [Acidimicrobiales bacterium]|nr:acetoacetate decarboxylase family protein [Acidimicrobiales bacterium]
MTSELPHAPWLLGGESLLALASVKQPLGDVPEGLRRVPGPCSITAARYDDSPVGPYRELAVGQPAHLGARVGLCITTMVVTSVDSRLGGRMNWGFPKEMGTLVWLDEGEDRVLRWEERDIVLRASPVGPPLPVLLPLRALQRRADGLVSIRGHARGRGRVAHVEVEVPADDPLAGLAGRHRGLLIAGMRLVMNPARRPVGLTATLRAPLRAPEPALTWAPQSQHTLSGD